MDNKQMKNPQLARERAVYDYLESLESGDIDGIIQSLQQAVYDAPLDQMLLDAHQAYFQEEQQEEQVKPGTLSSRPARTDLPALRSFSPRARPEQRKRRDFPVWMNVLAAVLVIGVLIGSFAVLLTWRQAARPSTPATASSTCTALKPYPAPDHGNRSDLLVAVTTVAPQDAWAVGYSIDPQVEVSFGKFSETLIEHWNGKRWQVMTSPNGKAGHDLPENGSLNAVAAVSAKDIWAVGDYQARKSGQGKLDSNTLIEHWNGVDWQVVPSPNSPSGNGRLNAVAALSADDVWAAGQATLSDGQIQLPLLEHLDGKQWRVVSGFPGAGLTQLDGLAALSARNIWVAGEQLVHWDGSRWKLSTFPDGNSFTQLSARTPDDIWAIGEPKASSTSEVEHWDGQKWSVVPLPPLASMAGSIVSLSGITAVTANDVWAVGRLRVANREGLPQEEQFLVLHWNGKTWQHVKVQVPQPKANNPARAIAIGYNQTWIVGTNGSNGHTPLIEGCA